jgi:glucose 1-dehydrogenase
MQGISGKTALITGASSGIGQAIALRLATEGANVIINYHSDPEGAESTQAKIHEIYQATPANGAKVIIYQADISDYDQVSAMFDQVEGSFGQIDILINNAGVQIESPSHETDTGAFQKALNINLNGPYFCSTRAIRHLLDRQSPGVIINISSVHELIPRPQYLSYAVSKGGLNSLTKTLALEYAKNGIRINSIGPGATQTPINNWHDEADKMEELAKHNPTKNMGLGVSIVAIVLGIAAILLPSFTTLVVESWLAFVLISVASTTPMPPSLPDASI